MTSPVGYGSMHSGNAPGVSQVRGGPPGIWGEGVSAFVSVDGGAFTKNVNGLCNTTFEPVTFGMEY